MSETLQSWRSSFAGLGPRVRTALVLIAVFLAIDISAAFTCIGRWSAFTTALAVVIVAALETARFSSEGRLSRAVLYSAIILVPVLALGIYLGALHSCEQRVEAGASLLLAVKSAVVALFGAIAAALVVGRERLEDAAMVMRELPLSVFLIGICGGALIALPLLPGGAWIVLWLVLVVSVNDSAAYFAGSKLGGPKLCPAVSPNKTISGSLAGLAAGAIVGSLTGGLSTAETWGQAFLLSVAVVLAAQVGDLMKSYLKRLHGVKDSGAILPGHGGVLDRVDGILAGALIVYVWVVGAW